MWRVHFIVGSMCHVVVSGDLLSILSQGLCGEEYEDRVRQRLVDFAAAGLAAPSRGPLADRAPPPGTPESEA